MSIYSFFLGLGKDVFTDILPGVHSVGKCHLSSLKESPEIVRNVFYVSIQLSVLHSLCCFLPSSKKSSCLKGDIGQIISIQIKKRKRIDVENSASQLSRWYVFCSCTMLISRVNKIFLILKVLEEIVF